MILSKYISFYAPISFYFFKTFITLSTFRNPFYCSIHISLNLTYRENMFLTQTEESETYALKPMNCPNAMVIYGTKTRSYKELPLKLGDTDALHRFEMSGTLNGLLRTREFRQDDAHIFITEDQIKESFMELFEITEKFYSVFGLNYTFRLGTRPESFMGDPNLWDIAEKNLKEILEVSKKDFFILDGDGAFYGPKIDI
ncbi:hypothetical protein EBU94_08515, partial [bacterium]|nr:hypothetical protein [bacterium]